MGVSPYRTAIDVYNSKMVDYDYPEHTEASTSQAMERGSRLEKYILEEYSENSGNKLATNLPMIRDKEYPFLIANIDAKVISNNDDTNNDANHNNYRNIDKDILVEAKSSIDYASSWGDEIPIYYKMQVAHYAHITNCQRVDIPVLFNGWQYKCFHYERNPIFEQEIRQAAISFWNNHVLAKKPPKATNRSDIDKLYKKDNSKQIIATDKINKAIYALNQVKDIIKSNKETEAELTAKIKDFMQDNQILKSGDDLTLASWKSTNRKIFSQSMFKQEHPALYKDYLQNSRSRVFRVCV